MTPEEEEQARQKHRQEQLEQNLGSLVNDGVSYVRITKEKEKDKDGKDKDVYYAEVIYAPTRSTSGTVTATPDEDYHQRTRRNMATRLGEQLGTGEKPTETNHGGHTGYKVKIDREKAEAAVQESQLYKHRFDSERVFINKADEVVEKYNGVNEHKGNVKDHRKDVKKHEERLIRLEQAQKDGEMVDGKRITQEDIAKERTALANSRKELEESKKGLEGARGKLVRVNKDVQDLNNSINGRKNTPLLKAIDQARDDTHNEFRAEEAKRHAALKAEIKADQEKRAAERKAAAEKEDAGRAEESEKREKYKNAGQEKGFSTGPAEATDKLTGPVNKPDEAQGKKALERLNAVSRSASGSNFMGRHYLEEDKDKPQLERRLVEGNHYAVNDSLTTLANLGRDKPEELTNLVNGMSERDKARLADHMLLNSGSITKSVGNWRVLKELVAGSKGAEAINQIEELGKKQGKTGAALDSFMQSEVYKMGVSLNEFQKNAATKVESLRGRTAEQKEAGLTQEQDTRLNTEEQKLTAAKGDPTKIREAMRGIDAADRLKLIERMINHPERTSGDMATIKELIPSTDYLDRGKLIEKIMSRPEINSNDIKLIKELAPSSDAARFIDAAEKLGTEQGKSGKELDKFVQDKLKEAAGKPDFHKNVNANITKMDAERQEHWKNEMHKKYAKSTEPLSPRAATGTGNANDAANRAVGAANPPPPPPKANIGGGNDAQHVNTPMPVPGGKEQPQAEAVR